MTSVNPYAAPRVEASAAKKYERIGGWLILVAISLVLTVVMSPVGVFILLFVGDDSFFSLPYLIFSIAHLGVIGIGALAGLVLMFRRSRLFPKYMIGFFAGSFLLAMADLAMAGDEPEIRQDAFRALIGCAIWIPYFIRSKRVAGTFVN